MSIDTTSDLDVFISASDFGLTATVDGVSVNGIFDNEYQDAFEVEGTHPVFICDAADITHAAIGDSVTIGTRIFLIRNIEKMDDHFSMLILEQDDTQPAGSLPSINSFESTTELAYFMDTNDFAEVVRVNSVNVNGIFDDNYEDVMGVGSTHPVLVLQNSDLSGVSIGDEVVANSQGYFIRDIQTDGIAFSTLILEEDENFVAAGELLLINATDVLLINATDQLEIR